MKKVVTLLVATCLFAIGLSAQNGPRYEGTLETGYTAFFSPDGGVNSLPGFDFHYIPGCRINQNIFVGGGIGLSPTLLALSMPIYANFKYYFTGTLSDSRLYPFVNASLGCNIGFLDGDTMAGYYLDISAGCAYELTQKLSLYLKAGLQSFSVSTDALLGPSFHIGVSF